MKLVTTVIPAYNAARTLATTLSSALQQTYPAHEIIVVNDGSSDATAEIIRAFSSKYPQLRGVFQENAGLASARNRGIAEALGSYVAPLDADDIWLPEKIAMQVAAIEAVPDAALAYGWFRKIDADDRVLPVSASPMVSGWAFHRHLDWNFISNGSTPLIRTDVAREIGYDPGMVDGCEDYLFQLQVARLYPFACAPAYVTGYRRIMGSMSSQVGRMIRAHLQMYALLERDAGPAARRIIRHQVARLEVERGRNLARRGGIAQAVRAIGTALGADAPAALHSLAVEARRTLTGSHRNMFAPPALPFSDYAADQPDGSWTSGRSPARAAELAALDASGPSAF